MRQTANKWCSKVKDETWILTITAWSRYFSKCFRNEEETSTEQCLQSFPSPLSPKVKEVPMGWNMMKHVNFEWQTKLSGYGILVNISKLWLKEGFQYTILRHVPMRIGIDATVRTGFIGSIWFGKEGAHTHFFGMIPIQSIPITMQEYGVQDLFTRWKIPCSPCRKFSTLTQPASMCCLSFCCQKHKSCAQICETTRILFYCPRFEIISQWRHTGLMLIRTWTSWSVALSLTSLCCWQRFGTASVETFWNMKAMDMGQHWFSAKLLTSVVSQVLRPTFQPLRLDTEALSCWAGKSELWYVTFLSGGISASWERKEAGREKAAIISFRLF